jgi:ADP-ribose pyrophosphatase
MRMDDIRLLHTGRHLELVQRGKWEFVRRTQAKAVVGIAALTDAGELLLVEQFRVPVGHPVIELPAGLVGDETPDEDLLDAARRELEEETGFTAAQLSILAKGPSSAGLCNEIVTLVKASGLRSVGAGGGVGDEKIVLFRVPLKDASAWLSARAAEDRLIDHKVHAALWWLTGNV